MARAAGRSPARGASTLFLAAALASATFAGPARAETPEIVEGASAIAYLNAQRQANGIPAFTKEERNLASWCPNEKGGVGGSPNRALSADPVWDRAVSPWAPIPSAPAPFHEVLIYDPQYTTVGDVNAIGPYNGEGPTLEGACVSVEGERPASATPEGFVFYSPVGASGVPPKVTAFEDVTPAQALGLPATTGPNLIAYAIPTFGHLRLPYAPHAFAHTTLETAGGEQVQNVETVPADDSFIVVPPPLAPNTEYVGEVLVSINASESVPDKLRFSTGPEEEDHPNPPATTEQHSAAVVQLPAAEQLPVLPPPVDSAVPPSVKILSVHLTHTGAMVRIVLSTSGTTTLTGVGFKKLMRTLGPGEHGLTLRLTKVGEANRKHHRTVTLSASLNVGARSVSVYEKIKL